MKTIHQHLPKFVIPEWRVEDDGKQLTIGILDIRDRQRCYLDKEVFTFQREEDLTQYHMRELSRQYFELLVSNGVFDWEDLED